MAHLDENGEVMVVNCVRHGEREEWALICQHLHSGRGKGYFLSPDADEKGEGALIDAWCAACEDVLADEGSWTERALEIAHFKLCCDLCHPEVLALNRLLLV